ncbi:MAG: DEAD/DEAH box helicase [Planctomycetota bacterium]
MQFDHLNLSSRLLNTLASKGYETPTPIQAQAIPPILEGRDLLGCAQTGTGKTAAFSLPLLDRLISNRPWNRQSRRRPRALILAPTRELAGQIEDSLRTYGRGTGLRGVVIYGGVKQYRQVRELEAGVDVIVATPGRLLDLMDQGYVDLGVIEVFVLDEADRMLDMGFIEPIRQIARELPEDRQTLLFSATMPPKIRQLADAMLHDPVSISVTPVASTAPAIDQTLYHVAGEHKPGLLQHLLQDMGIERTVVFTKTKHGAEKLAKKLSREGVAAGAIHGNKTQNQRQRALEAFRAGRSRVLVATDVAARGLDVDGITHVFNFNLPNEPEAYVHRIGRTGRAGATGQAISFCSRDERGHLRAIERLTGERIETSRTPEPFATEEPRFNHRPARGPQPRRSGGRGRQGGGRRGPARSRRG